MARQKETSAVKLPRQQKGMIGPELSFAAAEAYKLLRTNLMFALPSKNCSIIGVTSSVRGEGKSTTSVNLAYTFAEAGKNVLLIDADMRLPSVATKLSMAGTPGLSNLMAGLRTENECVRPSKFFKNWYVLPAGDIPPNPSELLGSERMRALLDRYSDVFDIIIIDLPPIGVVTDALAISPLTDGLIVVVRENYTERKELNNCMYQIRKLNAKFLGFVMTDTTVGGSTYKHYGKSYGYGYGYSDSKSSHRNEKAFREAEADNGTAPAAGESEAE